MARATLRGLDFYYEQTGSGDGRPKLLFVNGTGGDLRQQPRLFDGPLTDAFEIVAHDQRGLGQSAKPDGPYTMADYADDAAALLDHVGWDRVHVLGVSFGGMVAQELALRHPDRIDRLALCCTSSGGAGGASYPLHELAEVEPDRFMTRVLEIGDTRWASGEAGRDADRFALIVEFMKKRRQLPDDGEDPATKARGAALQLEARRGHDTWDRLAGIRAKTLLCGGRYDGIARPENMENLHARIPDAELAWFEGGHAFLLEDRSAYAKIVVFRTAD
ncbi:MAG: alpha/beta fold hydrolase [Myxococcota bacterium]